MSEREVHLLSDATRVDSFREFFEGTEARLRHALTASLGFEVGKEAAAEAFAYGWEHWDRVRTMDNPAGYLFAVGRDRGRRMRTSRRAVYPTIAHGRAPWVEPGLGPAMSALPEMQRTVILLLHGYQWTMSEVAHVLDISKASVQTHQTRGMRKLRRKLGVTR